jgi:hypothetical protein
MTSKKYPPVPTTVTDNVLVSDLDIYQGVDGHGHIKYHTPATKYFEESWTAAGSVTTVAADKKTEITTCLDVGEVRNYTIGGFSSTHESHVETHVEDTRKDTTVGDRSEEILRNRYVINAGKTVVSSLEGTVHNSGGGKSSAPTYNLSEGDFTDNRNGNFHSVVKKDSVQAVSGNKINIVENGDYAMHVQSGNWDTHIAKKARFYSRDDILIESETKITLKVGNSRIIIEPNHIQIISNNKTGLIDLN